MKILLGCLSLTLAGGLWPFGQRGADDAEATIGDLQPRPVELRRELSLADGERLAREQYRAFLNLAAEHPALRAEAMRRLADLSLSAGEAADMEGLADARFYADAIELYQQLLATRGEFADRDVVLYQLARARELTGDSDAALARLTELVSRYPDSRYYDEAQFRRGEMLFMARRYREAQAAYAAVIALGERSAFREQALYKHGWSLFKQGLHEESLDSFLAVLDGRLATAEGPAAALAAMSRPDRELVDDSFRVLAISFSYMDGPASLNALWQRRPDLAYADLLYAGLGDLYLDKERYQDAAETYAAFVRTAPTHPAAPRLQLRVIEAYTLGRFPSLVLEARRDYVRLFGFDSPFWQDRETADYPAVVAELKQSLSDLAAYDHALAQSSGDREAYARAAGWYRRYLAYFPQDPDSAQRSFLLAEILNELGQYAEATAQFLDAAYAYGPHERAAEAAYAAVLAARAHAASLDGESLAAWRERSVAEALRFADSFPAHPQAAAVRTKVAEELFAAGELERAAKIAELVVSAQPPAAPELERVALRVLAHARFDLQRYAEAEQAYRRLQAMPGGDPDEAGELAERIAASVYKQAEAARAAGEVDTAVGHFLRVADAAPGTDVVPLAIYDAAALLINAERWEDAAAVLEKFRRQFPAHALAGEVTQKLAVVRRAAGQSEAAAAEFERVAELAGAEPGLRREALWEAARLYAASGRPRDEQRVYETLLQRFPEPFGEALEARQKLADLALTLGDPTGRRHWLEEIVAADAAAGEARSPRSRTLAARASLELAAALRDAFVAAPLVIPLKASLKRKKSRMELALAAYAKAADYGVAEVTTAANFEIAELYYRLAQDLMDSERPPELSPEELEQYDILLEEQAFPLEEQAIELFAANAARAADGVYDDWVRRSFARLAELMPARYARQERSENLVAIID
ncbi:MAG: hypothetical protein D6727_03895 [Gammaproteobacteria bacterium]|nr:MAG: hypothetical protein D6727_03895 [Gammaproteobacteria bacterium]